MISQGFSFRRSLAPIAVVAFLLALCVSGAPSALAATGSIFGTVTGEPTDAPLAGVEVCARKDSELGNEGWCAWTRSDGTYEIGSLPESEYRLLFWPRHGTGLNYLRDLRDQVPVSAGRATRVDTELGEAGSIEGRVVSELNGTPLVGVEVCAYYQWEDHEPSCALSDAAGRYRLVGLGDWGESEYRLEFFPERSGLHYFRSYGGLVGFDEELDDLVAAEKVGVGRGLVTRVPDQTLKPNSEVRGSVTAAFDGRPLAGILVCVAPALPVAEEAFWWNTIGHERAKCSRTDGAGAYSIGKLEGGQYKVLFSLEIEEFVHYIPPLKSEADGYPTRYWRAGSSWADADILTLTSPSLVTGIDAELGPPHPPTHDLSTSPSPTVPVPPSLSTSHTSIPKPRCKRGRHLRKVDGHFRCTRAQRSPRKHHRHHAP